jgi:hypothetical protein
MDVVTCPRFGDCSYPIKAACLHHSISIRVDQPSEARLEAAAQVVLKGVSIKKAAAAYRVAKEDLRKHVEWVYEEW